jgi:two-component system, chemotaxis family, protein-glutamate methylesterase/glutaminase
MQNIRILIVDDSAVIRRMLREAFSADPLFEIVGAATNGRVALSMLKELKPDVMTLDIEMPEMGGLEALRHIREIDPKVPVIMFSTLTTHGAAATIDALSNGASDYVTKPVDVGNFYAAVDRIRLQLIPKVRALCAPRMWSVESSAPPLARVRPPVFARPSFVTRPSGQDSVNVLAIGTSTGGPNALAEVLPHIPADFPVPILIVQHMPPLFTRFLADRLSACCYIPVREAVSGQEVLPGEAWVAAGDYHMTVCRDGNRVRIMTDQRPSENSCRPSVDVLFRSVAETYRGGVLAVVMTGMGQDGLIGCERVRKEGGQIFAQDEPTSVVWGMPGFVAKAGLADRILPLGQIGPELVRKICSGRNLHFRAAAR